MQTFLGAKESSRRQRTSGEGFSALHTSHEPEILDDDDHFCSFNLSLKVSVVPWQTPTLVCEVLGPPIC